jgi:hypothetical protein
MKHLKKFEAFTDTGVDDGTGVGLPEYNPDLKLKITNYIDDLASRGAYHKIGKMIGTKINQNASQEQMDADWDGLRDRAIDYLVKNPEQLPEETGFKTFNVPAGDGIARTNKVGGVWGKTA